MKYDVTEKQYKILNVICIGNGTSDDDDKVLIPVDLDQLLERLTYKTTKQSMQFSIRALITRGFITKGSDKRRSASRATYMPTKVALQIMGYAKPSFIEDSDLSYLDI